MSARAPLLVLAVGNPSRGDDALGPLLAERLERLALPGVEVLVEFQLQVEHALDLLGREGVIFVDACVGTPAPWEWRALDATGRAAHTSHALQPGEVLAAYVRVHDAAPPPAWLLCVRGESFELGEPLSAPARANLEAAWTELQHRCTAREFDDPVRESQGHCR